MPIAFPKFFAPFSDQESVWCADHARASGRSWWAVRFSWLDDWVHEWDPDPASPNGHRDWPLLARRGRQAVRLYCPNGRFAQLGDTSDATGRLFEFKVGTRSYSIGQGRMAIESRETLGQVIGIVTGLNGECTLYAWEPVQPPGIPSSAPQAPVEQVFIDKSAEPGLFEQAVADWNRDIEMYMRTREFQSWEQRYNAWQQNAGGRLVGPVEDNVYSMKYQGVGKLKAEHLGIDDGEGS